MKRAEKIKELIASDIAGFLILEHTLPEYIDIRVIYPGTTARLFIPAEKICEALGEEAEG